MTYHEIPSVIGRVAVGFVLAFLLGCENEGASSERQPVSTTDLQPGATLAQIDDVETFVRDEANALDVEGWSVMTTTEGIVVYIPTGADSLADRVRERFPEVGVERGPPIHVVGE